MDTDKLRDVYNSGSFIAEACNPLRYIGVAREYRKPGKKAGDTYSNGEILKKDYFS